MTGLIRKATLLTVCGLLAASAALAGIPSAGTSSLDDGAGPEPNGLVLVGTTNPPDAKGHKTIVVRDGAGVVVAGVQVTINLSGCTGLRLCSVQGHPGVTVNCGDKTVSATTNSLGQVTFRVVGGTNNTVNGTPSNGTTACASVAAGGVPLGTYRVGFIDQDNVNGVNVTDLGRFVADFFDATPYQQRSDYDGDGDNDVTDLSFLVGAIFAAGSPNSCAVGQTCL